MNLQCIRIRALEVPGSKENELKLIAWSMIRVNDDRVNDDRANDDRVNHRLTLSPRTDLLLKIPGQVIGLRVKRALNYRNHAK